MVKSRAKPQMDGGDIIQLPRWDKYNSCARPSAIQSRALSVCLCQSVQMDEDVGIAVVSEVGLPV